MTRGVRKLTDAQWGEIETRHIAGGELIKDLAAEFGVRSELVFRRIRPFAKKIDELLPVARALASIQNNEGAAIVQLQLLLMHGQLEQTFEPAIRLAKISRYRFEFPVRDGRIDLLLFHIDGGVSIIEAKAQNRPNVVAAGIGQLFMYAEQLPEALGEKYKAKYINRILTAPFDPEGCGALIRACHAAGVAFMPLNPFSVVRKHADTLVAKHGAHIETDRGAMDAD